MSLPITARQMIALRALKRTHPGLGELATVVALTFDASKIDNPEMARLILETTCRRIALGEVGSHDVMIQHLEHFGRLKCLSEYQVMEFSALIKKWA